MTTANDPRDDALIESDDSTMEVVTPDENAEAAVENGLIADDPVRNALKAAPRNRHARSSDDKPVAIVTGAARRVGREIALAMAERGLGVVVHHGTSTVEANVLVNRIRSQGGSAVAVSADLRDPRAAAIAVFEAAAELGEVTTLINSAAVFQNRALPWIDLYHCNVHLSVNLLAPIFLSQQFIRQLGEGQRGHIINILDWRAQRPGADHLIYTSTKAALSSVTKSLALQLAPLIQVNGLAPGAILPPEDRTNWHEQRAITSIPLKRTGSPKELVDAINFLLDSNFITGEILNVSGGEEL
jgi:pteridine reductase